MPASRRLFLRRCASVAAGTALTRRASAAPAEPLLTLLDGDATLLRGGDKYALAEGVALQPDDIVDVPQQARLARFEFPDGFALALGPNSRALLAPRLTGERRGAHIYLLTGWAKLAAPAAVKATILAPTFDVATTGGVVVLSVQPATTLLFVEAGDAALRRKGAAPSTLGTGDLLSLATSDGARPETSDRPTPAFVASLPRAFADALPSRAAKFQDHPVAPRKLGPLAYADAQPWIDAEPALRQANLPLWRGMARDPEFRRHLLEGLKSHPEWRPILLPPPNPTPTRSQTPP